MLSSNAEPVPSRPTSATTTDHSDYQQTYEDLKDYLDRKQQSRRPLDYQNYFDFDDKTPVMLTEDEALRNFSPEMIAEAADIPMNAMPHDALPPAYLGNDYPSIHDPSYHSNPLDDLTPDDTERILQRLRQLEREYRE